MKSRLHIVRINNGSLTVGKNRAVRLFCLLIVSMSIFTSTGCIMSSISESSDSSSDSSKSSSKSSKSSSGESKESYLRDIKQYTAAYVASGNDMQGFTHGLTAVCNKHGVTDWEAYTATFEGIGEGFAKAALSPVTVDRYISYLAHGDQLKVAAIQKGFHQGQRF